MCGVCGFIRFNTQLNQEDDLRLDTMMHTLFHRGPDESGKALHDEVAMGMRRLSIIDIDGGSQPIYNEDRSIWTVFNGEIYNYPILKNELEQMGHHFATRSDTEAIVHGYESHAENFPEKLNGMFAIALHDRKQHKFILARDHLGIKPLYYCMTGDSLIFGSEIKAILASGLIKPELNMNALAAFLSWEYVPGSATLFSSIKKLLPGEMITVDLQQETIQIRQYWDIPKSEEHLSLTDSREWEERIEDQIFKSTQMQMISDVPLGAFLSGGVDSSLIVAAMGQVQTFSIGFDDPSYNELNWAQTVARHLGVSHTDEIIKPNVHELFSHLMHFMDDPIGDFSIFPTYLVSRLARQQVTVALSGDGGDELFAGYETYLAQKAGLLYERLPTWMRSGIINPLVTSLPPGHKKKGFVNKARRFIEGISNSPDLEHARWRLFMNERMSRHIFTREAIATINTPVNAHIDELFSQAGPRDSLQRELYVDIKSYLCDNILTKVDRMSMAVSLETRVPFLDPDMVSLAFRVPEQYKLEGKETKAILKRVAARHIPRQCIYRPKEGFSIPIKHWLNNEFHDIMENYLNESTIKKNGIFHWPTIKKLIQEHRDGRENHSHILWSLIVFHDWQNRWL